MSDKGLSAPDWGVCVHCCAAGDPVTPDDEKPT